MKLNRKNKKGFTIVELVIVIAVIGILAAILIPTFTNLTKNAQETAKKQQVGDAYTLYLTEAVDGKYDLFTRSGENPNYIYTDANIAIANKAQREVVLKLNDEYFTYDQEKGWENKGTTQPTNLGDLVCKPYSTNPTAAIELYDNEHALKFSFAANSDKDEDNQKLSTFNNVVVYAAVVNNA